MTQNKIIQHVSERLKQLRSERNVTLDYLAHKMNISRKQVQNYESSCCNIPVSRLWQLAECLGVDLNYFTQGLGSANQNYTNEDAELVKLYHQIRDKQIRLHIRNLLRDMN